MKISDKIKHIVRIGTLLAMLVLVAGTMLVYATGGDGETASFLTGSTSIGNSYGLLITKNVVFRDANGKTIAAPAEAANQTFQFNIEGTATHHIDYNAIEEHLFSDQITLGGNETLFFSFEFDCGITPKASDTHRFTGTITEVSASSEIPGYTLTTSSDIRWVEPAKTLNFGDSIEITLPDDNNQITFTPDYGDLSESSYSSRIITCTYTDANGSSKKVSFNANKSYTISDLPKGEYTFYADVDHYGLAEDGTFSVTVNETTKEWSYYKGLDDELVVNIEDEEELIIKATGNGTVDSYTFSIKDDDGKEVGWGELAAGESKSLQLGAGKYTVYMYADIPCIEKMNVEYEYRLDDVTVAGDGYSHITITNTYTKDGGDEPEDPPPPSYNYGRYYYVHEYYLKNPDGTLTLEGTSAVSSSGSIRLPDSKTYDSGNVTRRPTNNGMEYEYFEDAYGTYSGGAWGADSGMSSVRAEPCNEIIILRYVRQLPSGSYRVVHEYYFEDANGERTLEGTSSITASGDLPLDDTPYTEADVGREYVFDGRTYAYDDCAYGTTDGSDYAPDGAMGYVVATENGEQIIILRYVRRISGSYHFVHEYYFEDADGNLTFEGRSGIGSVGDLPLDDTTYTEADVERVYEFEERLYEFTSSAYGPTNGSEYDTDGGMTSVIATEDGEQIIILQYVRREGGYKIVHEYYFRRNGADRYEGRSEIFDVDGLPLNSQYDESGVDRVYTFGGHSYTYFQAAYGTTAGDSYAADGEMSYVVTTQNNEQVIILRYYREIVLPPDTPDPNDPDSPDEFTIEEDDVPKTYIRVWDPEEEEWFYVPEEDVPLFNRAIPETGENVVPLALCTAAAAAALAGLVLLCTFGKRRKAQ